MIIPFTFHADIVKRSEDGNTVRKSAYDSRTRQKDNVTGKIWDYSGKPTAAYSNILAPIGSPEWVFDRNQLWNKVEQVETRKDSQLSRTFMFTLPRELELSEQIEVIKQFLVINFVNKGLPVDFSVHHDDVENPHTHIQVALRRLKHGLFKGDKTREFNNPRTLLLWRYSCADCINAMLEYKKSPNRVDPRSLAAQGKMRPPTTHIGPGISHMKKRIKKKADECVNENYTQRIL